MAFTNKFIHEQKSLTSNQQATLQVPTGGVIQNLPLRFTTGAGADATEADIRAEISNIRLTINGFDVINTSPAKLFDAMEMLATRVGVPTGLNGAIELNLGALAYVDPIVRNLFGYGTADVANIQIQITAGTLTNVASVQAFSARQPVDSPLGAYMKLIDYRQSFNATGQHTVDTLPRDVNSAYLSLFVDDGASGTITAGECRVNQQINLDPAFPTAVNAQIMSNNGYIQPAGYFVYNWLDGSLAGRLPMKGVTDFLIRNTFSVAPGAGGYNITALTVVNLPQTVA